VPAYRAWHPSPSHGAPQRAHEEDGSCRRHGDVASTAGVRTELRTTGFTATVRWVVGARELRPPSERTLKGNEAHGRTEPGHVGNDASRPRTRRRSKALKPTQPSSLHTSIILATGWGGCGRPAARQRQEGNDRGDAERLSTGNILRGVRVALRGSRNGSGPPSSACRMRRTRNVRARNAANLMTGSGMQQARKPPGGGSRRSGAKPQGRNRTFGVDSGSRSATGTSRGSGRLVVVSVERRTARRSVSWPSYADESHERRSFHDQGERRVL
jgi:hypothetical protein